MLVRNIYRSISKVFLRVQFRVSVCIRCTTASDWLNYGWSRVKKTKYFAYSVDIGYGFSLRAHRGTRIPVGGSRLHVRSVAALIITRSSRGKEISLRETSVLIRKRILQSLILTTPPGAQCALRTRFVKKRESSSPFHYRRDRFKSYHLRPLVNFRPFPRGLSPLLRFIAHFLLTPPVSLMRPRSFLRITSRSRFNARPHPAAAAPECCFQLRN